MNTHLKKTVEKHEGRMDKVFNLENNISVVHCRDSTLNDAGSSNKKGVYLPTFAGIQRLTTKGIL